eukprot:gene1798-3489_t
MVFEEDMNVMKQLLSADGVIGLTVFAKNSMEQEIKKLLKNQNTSVLPPFSTEPIRFVKKYFNSKGLNIALEDHILLQHLSTKDYQKQMLNSYSKRELNDMITSVGGLKAHTWVPLSFANPYDEFHDMAVQSYSFHGISQENFMEDIVLASFRHVVYIVKDELQGEVEVEGESSLFPGRAVLNSETFLTAKDTIIIDQSGDKLKTLFASAIPLAVAQQSLSFSFSLSTSPAFQIHHACMPIILPAFSLLSTSSSNPTFEDLLRINERYTSDKYSVDQAYAIDLIVQTLQFLEKNHYISFWRNKPLYTSSSALSSASRPLHTDAEMESSIEVDIDVDNNNQNVINDSPPIDSSTNNNKNKNFHQKSFSDENPLTESEGNKLLRDAGFTEDQININKIHMEKWKMRQNDASRGGGTTTSSDGVSGGSKFLSKDGPQVQGVTFSYTKKKKAATSSSTDDTSTSTGTTLSDQSQQQQQQQQLSQQQQRSQSQPLNTHAHTVHEQDATATTQEVSSPPSRVSVSYRGRSVEGRLDRASDRSDRDIDRVIRNEDINTNGNAPKLKRLTAGPTSTSVLKLQFDIAQLKHIAYEYPAHSQHLIQYSIPRLNELLQRIRLNKKNPYPDTVFNLTSDQVQYIDGEINKALFISNEHILSTFTHTGAMNKLRGLLQNEFKSNDFIVLDTILENKAGLMLTALLSTSTMWFDVTNGNSFAAHSDDGLIHDSFYRLSQELEVAVTDILGMRVKRYYAVAMDINTEGTSATAVADESKGESVVMVLWVNHWTVMTNPTTEEGNGNENGKGSTSSNDGLHIYSRELSLALKRRHTMIKPDVHPNFISNNANSLSVQDELSVVHRRDINIPESDLIPRQHNRMVIIGPNRPYSFKTPGKVKKSFVKDTKPFESNTMFALVFVLVCQNERCEYDLDSRHE